MDSSVSLSRQARFKILSENICKTIEDEGFLIRPYGHPTLPYFNLLSIDEQEQVLKDLLTYFQVCTDMRFHGDSLKDTRKFTERALHRLNKRADPEHIIREKGSLERMEILAKLWWISPLFSTIKEDTYLLAVETSRLP